MINELFDWCFDFIFFVVIYSAAEAKRQLIDAGFDLLNENEEWELKPGGRYFFTRNMSCLVAFAIGEKWVKKTALYFDYISNVIEIGIWIVLFIGISDISWYSVKRDVIDLCYCACWLNCVWITGKGMIKRFC